MKPIKKKAKPAISKIQAQAWKNIYEYYETGKCAKLLHTDSEYLYRTRDEKLSKIVYQYYKLVYELADYIAEGLPKEKK